VVDGAFTRIEVETIVGTLNVPHTPDELIRQLLDAKLLFEGQRYNQKLYRTRSAETVRLTSRLKQWLRNQDWRSAPNLVADFRFASRPRTFPYRNVRPEALIAALRLRIGPGTEAELRLQSLVDGRDLSQFQVDATVQIASDLTVAENRGTVICAGTGSGKTLCFYLPVLSMLGSPGMDDNWTRVLALYPRNELLKDQLTNALGWIHRLNVRRRVGGRRLRVGAFFGPTPWDYQSVAKNDGDFGEGWRQGDGGYVCPYARCPECEGELVWPETDRVRQVEKLRCTRPSCGFEMAGDEVALTRTGMQRLHPDLLFTTTEMLNRQIADSRFARVFGVGASRPPRAVLLDELHTYDGVHGAHVAGLLRRWRHAIGTKHPVQFTGLSATLLNAREFLATITGLDPASVEFIEPIPEHCFNRGAQYQLALRGDPVSATALLSTTIQTSMLLGRMLDPLSDPPSEGAMGGKLFVFTDDLDAAHRLYANLQSAEGQPTRPWELVADPLANLRASTAPDAMERASAGQNWSACEKIGHQLNMPLRIELTSSRKRGVDPAAQVVVATAALEVGFDDDRVGAVLQHKAPRGAAAFIQRIGRAGRSQKMRPWSLIVLSDYGRDRLAYQRYEALFDPQLPARTLPIRNRYVLRIQVAYAFMDWLGQQAGSLGGSIWTELSSPADSRNQSTARQLALAKLIDEVLHDFAGRRGELEKYITRALTLDEATVRSLMWEEPRSLLFSVLPTTHRRLVTGWRRMPTPGQEHDREVFYKARPLPEFVPGQLFGDLNLPEVAVRTPNDASEDQMPVVQAMRAFAPGKVSRRFVVNIKQPSHWVPLPTLEGGEVNMPVNKFCERAEPLGMAQFLEHGAITECELMRPWSIQLHPVPLNIQPQSNANLVWRTQLTPLTTVNAWSTPTGSGWSDVVLRLRVCTHADGTQALVRRFAIGVEATTRKVKQEDETFTKVRFVSEAGDAASVGFEFEADALVFEIGTPPDLLDRWLGRRDYAGRSIRTAYFRALVMNDGKLGIHANVFLRDRLVEVFLSAITAWAASKQLRGEPCTLEQAATQVRARGTADVCDRVLTAIFRVIEVDSEDDAPGDEAPEPGANEPRLLRRLRMVLATEEVQAVLHQHAFVLWGELAGPDLDHFREWLQQRYIATLGQSLVSASRAMCPQTEAGDLVLDVNPGVRAVGGEPCPAGMREIWLSEELPGGTGVVEQFAREYASDPRRFFSLLDAALSPAEFEVVDTQLNRVIDLAVTDAAVRTMFEEYRQAVGHSAVAQAAERVLGALSSAGVRITPAVRSALFARVLRPGTSTETDAMLSELVVLREQLEVALGIEIDARVFAYVAGEQESVRRRLQQAVGGVPPGDPSWYSQQVYAILWPRGAALRASALSTYQPFSSIGDADRLLLEGVGEAIKVVCALDVDWREQVAVGLKQSGIVRLSAPQTESGKLRHAILSLATSPLEVGFMALHPRPTRITIDNGSLLITLRLREVM
jgi:hypothetical protein